MGIGLETLFKEIRLRAEAAGCFGSVSSSHGWLCIIAKGAAEHAEYRLGVENQKFWIALVTPDRWLSESVESDLVDNGDDAAELIDEEARSRGYKSDVLTVAHFRDDKKMYTFRTPIPISVFPDGDVKGSPANIDTAFTILMSYQEVFSELGDMSVAES
jgi:hypothetical protein